MTREEIKALIEKFLRLFGDGRFDGAGKPVSLHAIMDMMTDDVEWWIAAKPGSGLLTKKEFLESGNIFKDIADSELNITPFAWTIDGNRVAVEAYSYMKLKSGGMYNNHYHFLFEIQGGKISVFKEYFDTWHVKEAIENGRKT